MAKGLMTPVYESPLAREATRRAVARRAIVRHPLPLSADKPRVSGSRILAG